MDNFDINKLLNQPVRNLSSVGPAREKGFNSLNVFTFNDVLYYFPRRYEDRKICELDKIELYGTYAVRLKIATKLTSNYIKGGTLPIIKFKATEVLADEFGVFSDNINNQVDITFFHSEYLRNVFKPGEIYIFYGKITGNLVKFEMVNPKFTPYKPGMESTRYYPIYKKNQLVKHNTIIKAADSALNLISNSPKLLDELEVLPEQVRNRYSLC